MIRVLFVGFLNDYEKLEIESLNIDIDARILRQNKFIRSFLLYVGKHKFNIYIYLISFFYKKFIVDNRSSIVIFDDNPISLSLLKLKLKSGNTSCFKILLRNNISDKNKKDIVFFKKIGVEIFTFDLHDCEKYGLKYYHQYCSGFNFIKEKNKVPINECRYGLYFLGLDKGRARIVNKIDTISGIKNNLIQIKYQPEYFIDKIKKIFRLDIKYLNESYVQHLYYMINSSFIIDIVKDGQSGLTMRTVEAVMANKKIITNNVSILESIFYDAENVFYFNDVDTIDINEFKNFLKNPEVVKKYDKIDFNYSFDSVILGVLDR
ncbi:hypothetical protein [Photobacterium iliopiscarium]|uniref:hypothetical protein n=1 Tax=Photobacterium iliopiscarium TaxID=56192 RepID=UPI001E3A9FF8|nr:hypothetical protein [Photobacterium iliopiscarium]MCD9467693.1 hypothetical protein [Photobacterium iliopiscarium]